MINQRLTEAEQSLKVIKERNERRQITTAEALQFVQTQAMLALTAEFNRFNNTIEDQTKIGGAFDFRSLYKSGRL